MRTSPTVVALVGALTISVVLGTGALTTQPARDSRTPQRARDRQPTLPDREERSGNKRLHNRMEQMGDYLKKVSTAIEDEDRKAALRAVAKMQEHLLKAKLMTPALVLELDRADRPDKVTEYRRRTALALIEMTRLEIQILDNDFEAAAETVSGSLATIRNEGHEIFDPEG